MSDEDIILQNIGINGGESFSELCQICFYKVVYVQVHDSQIHSDTILILKESQLVTNLSVSRFPVLFFYDKSCQQI